MYIVAGTASQTVAKDIAKQMNYPLAKTTLKRFPDDEFYVRIDDEIDGEDVVLVQTTYPDEKVVELLLMQDAINEAGARSILAVVPYFGYGRQDKKFQKGEPISARALAKHISMHAKAIFTVDPHKEHILKFFPVPAYSCSAVPELARYLKRKQVDSILAPDKGAKERAQKAAKIVGCDYDYLEKTRIDGTTVEITPKNLDVDGNGVAIIDDIISTGGTMATSIRELKNQGAKHVFIACTHGVFAGSAKEKLLKAGCDDIISTNSIENEFSKVSVAPCLIEAMNTQFSL